MKKVLSVILVMLLTAGLVGCSQVEDAKKAAEEAVDKFVSKIEKLDPEAFEGNSGEEKSRSDKIRSAVDVVLKETGKLKTAIEKMPDITVDSNGKEIDTSKNKAEIIEVIDSLEKELTSFRDSGSVVAITKVIGKIVDLGKSIEKAPEAFKENETIKSVRKLLDGLGRE